MKIEYDPSHDVMNIEFLAEEKITDSVELDGVIIDSPGLSLSRFLMQAKDHQKPSRPD